MKKVIIKTEAKDQIGYLVINRPNKLNALSWEVVEEMNHSLDQLAANDDVKVIILSGSGKSFCAGGDIEEMYALDKTAEMAKWINFVSSLTRKLLEMDKYVIAAVQGHAAGAGFSLALAADFIVAEENAKFTLSFTNIGLIPDLGLMKLLAERVSPPILKEWISSGKVISAEKAHTAGIINRVVKGSVIEAANEFSQFIINGPALSHQYVKYIVNNLGDLSNEASFMQENMIQLMLLQTEDHKEGVAAFLENRAPQFKGK